MTFNLREMLNNCYFHHQLCSRYNCVHSKEGVNCFFPCSSLDPELQWSWQLAVTEGLKQTHRVGCCTGEMPLILKGLCVRVCLRVCVCVAEVSDRYRRESPPLSGLSFPSGARRTFFSESLLKNADRTQTILDWTGFIGVYISRIQRFLSFGEGSRSDPDPRIGLGITCANTIRVKGDG